MKRLTSQIYLLSRSILPAIIIVSCSGDAAKSTKTVANNTKTNKCTPSTGNNTSGTGTTSGTNTSGTGTTSGTNTSGTGTTSGAGTTNFGTGSTTSKTSLALDHFDYSEADDSFYLVNSVSYDKEISVMMSKYCTKCHSGMVQPSLSTYAEVSAAAANSLAAMQTGKMPPPMLSTPVPASEISAFAAWVTANKPQTASSNTNTNTNTNTTNNTNTTTPTTTVTYEGNIKSFLAQNCNSCHSGAQKPDLNTYENAKLNAASSLKTMQNGTMPPGKTVPSAQITSFSTWISSGHPQNNPSSTNSNNTITQPNDGC